MAETESQPNDEELISAYCDGELRGAELARAEELLAQRPELRQLLEEYRAMRSRLQEVPQRTLGSDFAQRVLRRAERDILVPMAPAAASHSYTVSPTPTKTSRWPQGRRPWVYAGLAAAAALIIMFVESKDQSREPLGETARYEPLPKDAGMSAPPATDLADSDSRRRAGPDGDAAADRMARPAAPNNAPRQAVAAARNSEVETVSDDLDVKRAIDKLGWSGLSSHLVRQAATVEQQQGGRVLPSDVLVVECNIAPQNRNPDPMIATFLDNSIAVDARSAPVETRLAKAKEIPAKKDDRPIASNAAPAEMSVDEPVELFFVVATPEQLEATLADLGNRPGVSVNRLIDNRSLPAGAAGQGSSTATQRQTAGEKREDGKLGGLKPGRDGRQAQQQRANVASQQGRAQRLDVPEKMRRLIERSPAAGQQNRVAADDKQKVDSVQTAPASSAAHSAPALNEQAKTPDVAPSPKPSEQVPLQRALFIVRNRVPD